MASDNEKIVIMKPQKKGDKFKYLNGIYTVKSFFGKSGIEYDTIKEAYEMNPNSDFISIMNEEFGGASTDKYSTLIN